MVTTLAKFRHSTPSIQILSVTLKNELLQKYAKTTIMNGSFISYYNDQIEYY